MRSGLGLLVAMALCAGGCVSQTRTVVDVPVLSVAREATPVPSGDRVIRFFTFKDLLLVPVAIEGESAGFFLIDTCSSLSVVDAAVARKMNLRVVREGFVTGIGGRIAADYVRIGNLTVGGHDLGMAHAAVVDLSGFARSLRWPVHGIVGIDTLRSGPFTIDYHNSTLTLHDRSRFTPPHDAHAAIVRMRQGLPAIEVRIDDHEPIWAQIDTGANGWFSLPLHYVKQRPAIVAGKVNQQAESHGVAGRGGDFRSEIDRLTVFGLELHQIPVSVEMPPADDPDAATQFARIGNGLLKSFTVTFDLPSGRVYARFNP